MSEDGDFFHLFGLPRQYPIDRSELESAYERLSLAHHPDFFSASAEADQREAELKTAQINEGYRVLVDDAARAAYLLNRLIGERELNKEHLPPGFLGEMFELQEEVEDLEEGAAPERRASLGSDAKAKLHEILAERRRLFEAAGEGEELSLLQEIQTNLNCERYLNRLLARLNGQPADH